MEFKTFTARTVDDAINQAMLELKISSDELEYEVYKACWNRS